MSMLCDILLEGTLSKSLSSHNCLYLTNTPSYSTTIATLHCQLAQKVQQLNIGVYSIKCKDYKQTYFTTWIKRSTL